MIKKALKSFTVWWKEEKQIRNITKDEPTIQELLNNKTMKEKKLLQNAKNFLKKS